MIIPYDGKHPKLAERCFVAPNATVIGDVELGEESSIWFGTVVRGDVFHIRIGARTNIQDNSVIHVTTGKHATIVGDGVTVGHRVILHGCTIQDGALIGMGAIVMDRAVVGAGTLVAAGALVTEGTQLPPGVLAVGAPARPKRALTSEEQEHLRHAAKGYAELAATYAASIGWR
jgi:gamma-carbonic anhydrase